MGWYHDYSMPTSDWILENEVRPLGVNWIKINQLCWQETDSSTTIDCSSNDISSDNDLIHLTEQAHRLGIRVMLELGMDVRDKSNGGWAATIGKTFDDNQWQAWFASYNQMVIHYAALAEQNHIDYFTVGSELETASTREKEWRALVAEVRQTYHGPILYSSDEEFEWTRIKWWDAVDAIGLHPYNFQLSTADQPTVEQVTATWKPITDRIEALSRKWDRPIIITEIGYESQHGISNQYMYGPNNSWKLDVHESAVLYQALVNAFRDKPWFRGLFWFRIDSWGNDYEPSTFLFNAYKPEEDVVRSFYGAPPMPTQTPSPVLPLSFSHIQTIYDDRLGPAWENYPPNGDPNNIDLSQTEIARSGSAIKASLASGTELIFNTTLGSVDLSPYQWLEFYVYIPKDAPTPPMLIVSLRDADFYLMPHYINLTNSQYIQDSHLEKGIWQRVDIPLSALGPFLEPIHTLTIVNDVFRPTMTIYVDDIRLLGN